jgi:hypothetical protein
LRRNPAAVFRLCEEKMRHQNEHFRDARCATAVADGKTGDGLAPFCVAGSVQKKQRSFSKFMRLRDDSPIASRLDL